MAVTQPARPAVDSISMDWLPTLLAAAGAPSDPAYPPDGINLLPFLIAGAVPIPRKLFWRYKANAQHAARDGDMKYLKNPGQYLSLQCR
jgi:hypothetical protein